MNLFFVLLFSISGIYCYGQTIIYADNFLSSECTSGNYSIENRDCSGSDGDAYVTVNDAVYYAVPGDTVMVREGNIYNETVWMIDHDGLPDAWRTIMNFPGEIPHMDGEYIRNGAFVGDSISYVRIEGFYLTGYEYKGINMGWQGNATYIEIKYIIGDDNGQSAVAIGTESEDGINHTLIKNCIALRNGSWGESYSSGINLLGANGTDNIVEGNVSFHNVDISDFHTDGNGFIFDISGYAGGATFRNNLAFLNGGGGFVVTHAANARILNNTSYHNVQDNSSEAEIGLYGEASHHGTEIINNIAVKSPDGPAAFSYHSTLVNSTISNNHFYPDSTTVDPQFTNPDIADFSLMPTSPVIDEGLFLAEVSEDIGFDCKCLKENTNQAYDWWTFDIDFDYIRSIGGIKYCFQPKARPVENDLDLGAYEFVPTVLAEIKIFLEGPYDANNNLMLANLDSNVPKTSPYIEDPRTVGRIPDDVVDWILVELRETSIDSALASKSVFLKNNGRFITDAGSDVIELYAEEGEYYLVVKHRNHLAVMSKDPVTLSRTTSDLYDFTQDSEMFYGTGGSKQLE